MGNRVKDILSKFSRATIKAAMADRPEIMQAAGWNYDKDGNLVQGDPNEEGASRLRNALSAASAASVAGPAAGLAAPVVGSGIAEDAAFLGTQAGKAAATKAAVDMVSSLAGGAGVDYVSSLIAPYGSFGQNLVWATGNNPDEHPLITAGAEFLNPGYGMGNLVQRGVKGALDAPLAMRRAAQSRAVKAAESSPVPAEAPVVAEEMPPFADYNLYPEVTAEEYAAYDRVANPKLYLPKADGNTNVASTLVETNPAAVVAAASVAPYQVADLGGGYMLKSLMRGNPLEKQIGKNGTVNANNIRALIGKGSKVEQAVVDKVLASEEFVGKKSIDYNQFRKAVQKELITYDRHRTSRWDNYGLQRLGFNEGSTEQYGDWQKENGLLRTATYTFESDRIPNGSAKHYDANTLGHSRTYTTTDEPDVLHVMESQSDWAQKGLEPQSHFFNSEGKDITEDIRRSWTATRETPVERMFNYDSRFYTFGETPEEQAEFDKLVDEYHKVNERIQASDTPSLDDFRKQTDLKKRLEDIAMWPINEGRRNRSRKKAHLRSEIEERIMPPSDQERHLADNFTSRQIQENLRYAAEKDQTKMRYPTRETAAKIEGYPKQIRYYDKNGFEVKDPYEYPEDVAKKIEKLQNEIDIIDMDDLDTFAPFDIVEGSFAWGSRNGEVDNAKYLAKLRDRIARDEKSLYEMRKLGDDNPMVTERLYDNERLFDKQIERYRKEYGHDPELDTYLSKSRDAKARRDEIQPELKDLLGNGPTQLKSGLTEKTTYAYEDILRKYTEFPKQYQKLYKGAAVRTVTDSKGNTWYEVDVPDNYLKLEWPYKYGGTLLRSYSAVPVLKIKDLAKRIKSSENSSDLVDAVVRRFSGGGSIHIDPSKKGTFTAQATRMGMGVQEAARHIHAHPDNYSPVLRRKAAFALAASKWNKKEDGGILDRLHDFTGGDRQKALEIVKKYQKGGFWDSITRSLGEARDAKIGAVGAQQVRDLYNDEENELARNLAGRYGLASALGIGMTAAPKVIPALMNPLSATTELGAAASTAADAYGVASGLWGLGKSAEKALHGQFTTDDIAPTIMDATTLIPGTSILTDARNLGYLKSAGETIAKIPSIVEKETVLNRLAHPVETYRFAEIAKNAETVLPKDIYEQSLINLSAAPFHNAPRPEDGRGYWLLNRKPAENKLGVYSGWNQDFHGWVHPEVYGLGDPNSAGLLFPRGHEFGHLVSDAAEQIGYKFTNYPPSSYQYTTKPSSTVSASNNPLRIIKEYFADVVGNSVSSDMQLDKVNHIAEHRYSNVKNDFPRFRKVR